MAKISFDIQFIHHDTPMHIGKSLGKVFIAFSPYPKGVESKAKWRGWGIESEKVARELAKRFTEIADYYKENTCENSKTTTKE